MSMAHIQDQVVRAPRLRAAPVAAEAALRILSIGELDASTLALVISADPVLTAAVVRATEPCAADTSITRRIASLSPARMQSALFPVLSDAFTEAGWSSEDERLWKQALATAVAAESIARVTNHVSPDQAYLFGLMRHFGVNTGESNDNSRESQRVAARASRFPEWLGDCLFAQGSDGNEDLVEVIEIAKEFGLAASSEACAKRIDGRLGLDARSLQSAHADFVASYERRLTLFSFAPTSPAELRGSLLRFANQLLLSWRVDENVAQTARERAAQLEALYTFNQDVQGATSVEEIASLCAEMLRSTLSASSGMLSVWGRRSACPRGFMWHSQKAPLEPLGIPDGFSGVQAIQQILSDPFWQSFEGAAPCALPVRTPSNRLTGYIAISTPPGDSAHWLARLDEWTRALGATIEAAEEHERQRLHNDALRRTLQETKDLKLLEQDPAPAIDRDAVEAGQRNLARAVVAALQSPLSAITAQTSQLTSQTAQATDAALLKDIAKHARGAARVLNDVQALAHAGSGNRELILINAPLRQFLNLVRPRLNRRSIQLEEKLAEGLPRVRLDARKLHHILLNVFGFIEKRLGHSSRKIVVSSAVTDDREGVSITIDVTGLALTDAQAEHLFTPLDTASESSTEHALLLAACGALVREFGGLLTACTHPAGATFMLAFESIAGNSAPDSLNAVAQPTPEAPKSRDGEAEPRNAIRILVVDDDDGVREILAQALRKGGHIADLAKDGVEALHAIEKKSYDLVLLDMLMPNRDGLAVLRELQANANAPTVIVMTGSTASSAREEAAALGAHNFLQKPFELRKLLAEVESVILHRVG